MADGRIPGKQLLSDVQWRPGALMAHQLVFGSNPVDLFGLKGKDEDLLFAQDTSSSARLARQRKPRMMAPGDRTQGIGQQRTASVIGV